MFNVNEYFQGSVKSIAFQCGELPATIGVMAKGEYEFSTNQKETMTVTSGSMNVKLPGQEQWQTFSTGDSFVIAAHEVFHVKAIVELSYLCTYE